MRQPTPEFGQVQRQVTARPVASLRAPQQDVLIDPNANAFAKGLAQFADVAAGVVGEKVRAAKDAQAATADIGLANYKQAMSSLLESNPGLYENPDELSKKKSELFEAYFGNVTDEEIRGKVIQRTDAWMMANQHTYQFQKEDKQRYELGLKSLALSVDALEAQKKAGASPEELKGYLKSVVKHYQTSPSFGFSQERTEEAIKTLQDSMAGERAVLLAETFMDDPEFSTETQLWLKAKHAEAMQMTQLEKEKIRNELFSTWRSQIQKGALKASELDEAVALGYITAKEADTWKQRQVTELKARAQESQELALIDQAFLRGDALALRAADPRKAATRLNQLYRMALAGQYPGGLEGYYSSGMLTGMGADPAKQGWQGFQRILQTPREPGEKIPQQALDWLNTEGAVLFNNNIHGAILPPQDAADLAFVMHATQQLQKPMEEVAMLLNPPPESRLLDIAKMRTPTLEQGIRKALGSGDGAAPKVALALDLALRYRKLGYPELKAIEMTVKDFKDSHEDTGHGSIPRSLIAHYGKDAVIERVQFKAANIAKDLGWDKDDIKIHTTPDGYVTFYGPDGINRTTSIHLDNLTAKEEVNPDGTKTIAGEVVDSIREGQLRNDRVRTELNNISNSIR